MRSNCRQEPTTQNSILYSWAGDVGTPHPGFLTLAASKLANCPYKYSKISNLKSGGGARNFYATEVFNI